MFSVGQLWNSKSPAARRRESSDVKTIREAKSNYKTNIHTVYFFSHKQNNMVKYIYCNNNHIRASSSESFKKLFIFSATCSTNPDFTSMFRHVIEQTIFPRKSTQGAPQAIFLLILAGGL